MTYFLRNKEAARVQESDWRRLVKVSKRAARFVPKPCAYCGVIMTMGTQENQGQWTNETQDHIVPKSKGGTVTVACCQGCNNDKMTLTLNEWRCVLMLRMKRPILLYHFELLAVKNAFQKVAFLLSTFASC